MDEDVILEEDSDVEHGEGVLKKLRERLKSCEAEKQEYLDGWQRARADFVNAQKRFEEERKGALELGKVRSLEAFLPAIDSLERAEAVGEIPENFKGIAKQLHEAANVLGLTRFGAIGEPFDPMRHEALGQDETNDASQDDIISQVLESGWQVNGSVVRAAKVRVFAKT
jgi:molecular chaperone GrpE